MIEKSKYISLKNYVPTGIPSENDFMMKEEEIELSKFEKCNGR